MVTILLFVAASALLYGLIQLSEVAFQRWLPNSALGQNPIATDNGSIVDNLAYGMTGLAVDTTGTGIGIGTGIGTGIGSAIATEMAGETAAIGEAIAPIVESSQHFIAHGAEAIGHAMGEVLSGL
jgi:hypothetical protein